MDLSEHYINKHITLFPQQISIIEKALKTLYYLILGEPGVGKTVITVYLIKIWFSLNLLQKVLILTKNEVLNKYKEELLKHIPFLKNEDILVMQSNNQRRIFDTEARIYICDYNQIKLVYEQYAGKLPAKRDRKVTRILEVFPINRDWAVVFDEIQALKNIKSDVHKIVYKNTKNALAKIATSGTPTEKIEEYYAVFKM